MQLNLSTWHLLTYLLTPWTKFLLEKLTGFAANQEIPRILCNPKFHSRTHKRPPQYCYVMPPLETLPPPPGDPSGGVFYLRIVLSPEEASRVWVFHNILFFTGRSC